MIFAFVIVAVRLSSFIFFKLCYSYLINFIYFEVFFSLQPITFSFLYLQPLSSRTLIVILFLTFHLLLLLLVLCYFSVAWDSKNPPREKVKMLMFYYFTFNLQFLHVNILLLKSHYLTHFIHTHEKNGVMNSNK